MTLRDRGKQRWRNNEIFEKKKIAFTLTKVKRKPESNCQSESQRVVRGNRTEDKISELGLEA